MGNALCGKIFLCGDEATDEINKNANLPPPSLEDLELGEMMTEDTLLANSVLVFHDEVSRLEEIRKKIWTSPLDSLKNLLTGRLRNFHLERHKLIFEGYMNWSLSKEKTVRVRAVLLDGILLLLQEEDEKYVLKFHNIRHSNSGDQIVTVAQSPIVDIRGASLKKSDYKSLYISPPSCLVPYHLLTELHTDRKIWWRHLRQVVEVKSSQVPNAKTEMLQYLSGHFKKLKFNRHETESFLFYLHYRVTFLLLMACCIVVTSNLFAGAPIVCTDTLEVSSNVMASYCWSHSTYSIASAYDKMPGKDIPYPGVDVSEDESEYIYRDYYQWIYLVLFVQGVFFYVPHGLWKSLESGKMEQLCKNIWDPPSIHLPCPSEKQDGMSRSERLHAGAVFFFRRWGWFNKYALGYWFCEILSWLNVIVQVWFLNAFFQGEFVTLGGRAVEYFRAGHFYDNPLSWVFPRVTKCHFHKFGPSGHVDTVDVLCILPVNALTEKIYLVIWFWFLALFGMSSLGILWTFLTLAFPKIRGLRLSLSLASVQCSKSNEIEVLASDVGRRCGFGDWFVLDILANRMDILDFKQFLIHLQEQIAATTHRNKPLNKYLESATAV